MLIKRINWVTFIKLPICITFVVLLFNSNTAYAGPWYGFADVVLDFYDSGTGNWTAPYGGIDDDWPITVPTDVVLGDDLDTFLSLPTGSYVTVGFLAFTVIDGTGNDIYITELDDNGEQADVYITSNLSTFTFLGTASAGVTTGFDLNSIGYTDPVIAIKIVGLDNYGATYGFDLAEIEASLGSIGSPLNIDPAFICKDSSGNNVAIFDNYGNLFLKGGLTENTMPAVSANDEFVILDSYNNEVAIIDTSTGDMDIYGDLYEYYTNQTLMNVYAENFFIKDSSGNVKADIEFDGDLYLMGRVFEYYSFP